MLTRMSIQQVVMLAWVKFSKHFIIFHFVFLYVIGSTYSNIFNNWVCTWGGMIDRCTEKRIPEFHYYDNMNEI